MSTSSFRHLLYYSLCSTWDGLKWHRFSWIHLEKMMMILSRYIRITIHFTLYGRKRVLTLFRVNYLIERHLQVSYFIVDDHFNNLPTLTKDIHWKDNTIELPNTKASFKLKNNPLIGSTANFQWVKFLIVCIKFSRCCEKTSKNNVSNFEISESILCNFLSLFSIQKFCFYK